MVNSSFVVIYLVFLCLLVSGVTFATQNGLVAHYTFEEGSGDVLRDHSGHNNHGQIHGAKWVRNGSGWALHFDGVDDCVNCGAGPTLDLRDAFTLEAWVYAEPIYCVWLAVPILGNGNYAIGQQVSEIFVPAGYAGLLPFRKWVHLAVTYDGRVQRVYVDGVLRNVARRDGPLPPGGKFWIADARQAEGWEPPDYAKRFKGKVAEVRLYNRGLTHEEVLAELRATNITGSVIASPVPLPGRGQILVEVDAARLGQPLDNLTVDVSVCPTHPYNAPVLIADSVKQFNDLGRTLVVLNAPELERGEYIIRTIARDVGGKRIGVPGTERLSWPGASQFPRGPQSTKKLNNLVTELLRVPGSDSSGADYTFVNPRLGWVYIANRGLAEVELVAEGAREVMNVTLSQDYGDAYETMRYLPEGKYTITVPVVQDLIVRAVAETVYDYTPSTPHIAEFGPYAGEFEERYVYPHTSTFVLVGDPDAPYVAKWKAKGRRFLGNVAVSVYKNPHEGQSKVDAAYEALTSGYGFTHSHGDGCVLDEFSASDEGCAIWAQAIDKALSEPRFQGKSTHTYDYALFDLVHGMRGGYTEADGRELLRILNKHGSAVLWECYVKDRRTELEAWLNMNDKLVGEPVAGEKCFPGLIDNVIVVFYGYVTGGPPWMTTTLPNVNVKTYLDMQFQMVATHPVYGNVHGLGVYRSSYADEETVRWVARLFRHYGIEGHTEMLSKDPYLLTHIQNPDFEQHGQGWSLKPADEESIRFDIIPGFGTRQGRYNRVSAGDTVIVTTRSDQGPNVFSQEIKGLEPGRLYSLRLFSADHQDMSKKEKHAVMIKLDNATLVPDKCFTHLGRTRDKKGWLNYHYRVFRAEGQTATLSISDWQSEEEPGGPIGQELMFNYIKVQPYWSE